MLFAAALCALACVAAPAQEADDARIRELVSQLAGGSTADRFRARNAVIQLAKIGKPAVPLLVEATQSKEMWTRSWSASALGKIGDARAVSALEALLSDGDSLVRCVAVYNLGSFAADNPDLSRAIAARLTDPAEGVRTWAYRSITKNKLTHAAPALAGLLDHAQPDTRLKAFIAKALLAGKLPADEARAVCRDAKKATHRQTALAVIRAEDQPKAGLVELYLAALDDPEDIVKLEGVLGLEWLLKADAKIIDAKLHRLMTSALGAKLPPLLTATLPDLRGHAMRVLARGKGQEILPQILDAVRTDPEAVVRANAVQALALAGIQSGAVADAIAHALSDPDEEVRTWAWRAFQWVTGKTCPLPYSAGAKEPERAKQVEAIQKWRRGEGTTP